MDGWDTSFFGMTYFAVVGNPRKIPHGLLDVFVKNAKDQLWYVQNQIYPALKLT